MTEITTGPAPAAVFADMDEESFMRWKHHPVTAAFLKYLGHQADNWREAAMDMWEAGRMDTGNAHEDLNSNVVRGKVLALRDLQSIRLENIKRFYEDMNGSQGE